jgi:LysR family transcriptional regulator, low CO2-responsive transcriptional regulator
LKVTILFDNRKIENLVRGLQFYRMQNLTLKQLSALIAVSRIGSVTGAADFLSITPSAMTTRIKELELVAGLPLFERSQRGMRLNEAGTVILRMATHINSAVDLAEATLADLQGLKTGRLSVGIVSTAKYFAPHIIAAFSKQYPGIEVSLTVGNRQLVIEALQQMTIDLAIMGRPPDDSNVTAEIFGDHPYVIIAPCTHRLTNKLRIKPELIVPEPFLLREQGSGTRRVFEEFFLGRANRRSNVTIEIGSNETIKQGVIAGLGLALISAHTVEFEVESRRLAILDVIGMPILRNWFITRRLDKTEMPASRAFRHFIRAEGVHYLPA